MPSPFQEAVVFGEVFNGFTSEIGRSSGVRLSTMGSTIPKIDWQGTFVTARGNGGPLHIHLPDFKSPIGPGTLPPLPQQPVGPINPDINTPADVKHANLVIASLVHMMGGAVTIQPHEIEHARNLTLEAENLQDPFMIRIRAL